MNHFNMLGYRIMNYNIFWIVGMLADLGTFSRNVIYYKGDEEMSSRIMLEVTFQALNNCKAIILTKGKKNPQGADVIISNNSWNSYNHNFTNNGEYNENL